MGPILTPTPSSTSRQGDKEAVPGGAVERTALVAAWLLAAGCGGPPEVVWVEEDGVRWRVLEVDRAQGEGFTALTARASGLDFRNDPEPDLLVENQHLANGAGTALGDVNGDGLTDIFLTHTGGANALYLNRGGLRFERADESAGTSMPGLHPSGAAFADVDGDGDRDLLVSSMGSHVRLLVNDGTGHFADGSAEAGFDIARAGSTLALADIDLDGDLDLYATNYKLWRAADVFPPEVRREHPVLIDLPDGSVEVAERYRDHYEIVRGSNGEVMSWEFGEEDDLWLNDGTGHFDRTGVTAPRFGLLGAEAGSSEGVGRDADREPRDWGLSARFHDVDGDGDPDLYVANDFESPDRFWLNDGTGHFAEVGAPALPKTSHASMSIAFGDVDADGLTDIFVADMLPLSTRRRKTQVPMLIERRPPAGDTLSIMQVNRNTLQLRRPDGSFAEAARWAEVDASDWTWGSELFDVDLDGDLDLVAVNGHRWDPLDGDTGVRMRETAAPAGTGEDWREIIDAFPELRVSNVAFRNHGRGQFDLADDWGLDLGPDISHGLATGDLDGDGDLDLVINRLGDVAVVLRNDASAHRVAVRLVGLPPNTDAVGARVRIEKGRNADGEVVDLAPNPTANGIGGPGDGREGRPSLEAEVGAGGLYLSHADGQLVFATLDADSFVIAVRWPDGRESRTPARTGRLYEITEASADSQAPQEGTEETDQPAPSRQESAADPGPASGSPSPLFADVPARVTHLHRDDPYDAQAQPLLPRSLDRLGPGIAWVDIDDDGDPDLVSGGGAGGRLTVAENRSGFVAAEVRVSSVLEWDVSGLVPEPDGSVLAGVANWEARNAETARSLPPVWQVATAADPPSLRPALESDGASTGPLASADIDGDGDLDLFIGGRAYQHAYPLTPRSRIFLRREGRLEHDPEASKPVDQAGLVSGATFSDLDGDGDPDLALALDWGSPRVYINESGRLTDRSAALGLGSHLGWWNGVAAGDVNGDGLMDLVLTSWGTNTGLRPTPTAPVFGHWGDFDRGGSLDLLLAQHDPRIGDIAPRISYPELRRALPYVRSRTVPSFSAYADASLEEVLGPSAQTAQVVRITTLEHTVFLNRGDRFEAAPLPQAAQLAPAHGVTVADFNHDGAEDIALAQNFFPDRTGAERHDSGRGLILLGNGRGDFAALSTLESGVSIAGDQRGLAAADFDGDARTDLAFGVNAGPPALYRNAGGDPGIRVRLVGRPGNPSGVGARVRLRYRDGEGPVREVRAGSGFWSSDGAVQVLGVDRLRSGSVAVEVRWPDGRTERTTWRGEREIVFRR